MAIWGLVLKPQREYSITAELGFTVTGAAGIFPSSRVKKGRSTIFLRTVNATFALGSVDQECAPQLLLSVLVIEEEDVTFFCEGDIEVHLTGVFRPPEKDGGEHDTHVDDIDVSDDDNVTNGCEPFSNSPIAAETEPPAKLQRAVVAAQPTEKPRKKQQPTSHPPFSHSGPECGVAVHDLVVGKGAEATFGCQIAVYYSGQLTASGKQFDARLYGKPFSFRVGSGVIEGWSVGVIGMRVGGKRRLVIPAALGYRQKGSPPAIPRNASLTFEIELLKVTPPQKKKTKFGTSALSSSDED